MSLMYILDAYMLLFKQHKSSGSCNTSHCSLRSTIMDQRTLSQWEGSREGRMRGWTEKDQTSAHVSVVYIWDRLINRVVTLRRPRSGVTGSDQDEDAVGRDGGTHHCCDLGSRLVVESSQDHRSQEEEEGAGCSVDQVLWGQTDRPYMLINRSCLDW